ncbi:hypothetical protein [Dysgonomonas sp. 25]|uniref:hypothetical protein n=1 Tax=Dysgonomonas sp. 25 TaxID=2302933 RepID=UPI0013D18FDA|nr:hypothetical protein [Dysgonomonas sp. 25]NDV69042.1 hypothetical protein [Dysgonomonas sp. 25]
MDKDLLKEYQLLNNSFKKKYVFHLGADAGFYSEVSNMIFAILYCLKYEYQFILYSEDANFAYQKGWRDFFLPFCKETTFFLHHFYNDRYTKPQKIKKRHYPIWVIYKLFNRNTSWTYQLWHKYFSKEFDGEIFDIPSLGIHGDIREAASVILKMIYRYNDQTIEQIQSHINKLSLPTHYTSMQIRRGDKIIECLPCPIEKYFDAAAKYSKTKDLFILTDDYDIIEVVSSNYPEWNVKTLTTPDERGYNHKEFSAISKDKKKAKLIKLFSSIEIIKKSDLFLGTYTTNVGLFLGMAMPFDKVISIQKKSWFRFADDDIKEQLVTNNH